MSAQFFAESALRMKREHRTVRASLDDLTQSVSCLTTALDRLRPDAAQILTAAHARLQTSLAPVAAALANSEAITETFLKMSESLDDDELEGLKHLARDAYHAVCNSSIEAIAIMRACRHEILVLRANLYPSNSA